MRNTSRKADWKTTMTAVPGSPRTQRDRRRGRTTVDSERYPPPRRLCVVWRAVVDAAAARAAAVAAMNAVGAAMVAAWRLRYRKSNPSWRRDLRGSWRRLPKNCIPSACQTCCCDRRKEFLPNPPHPVVVVVVDD